MPSSSCRGMSRRWLAMNHAGTVGGGERVVGAGEYRLVQAQLAEGKGAVARARGRRPPCHARLGVGAGDHENQRHERADHDRARHAGSGQRPAAHALRLLLRLAPPTERRQELRGSEEHEHAAAHNRRDLEREGGVEHDEHPDRDHRGAAQRARPAGLGPCHDAGQAVARRLEVLRVERGRRGPHGQPEQRKQQRPEEQVADEGVEQPRDGVSHLLVGHLVLAPHPGQRPGAQDQERDRDQRARRAHRDARSQHPHAAVGGDHDGAGEQEDRQQRQDEPQHADVVRHRERGAGELAPPECDQVGLEVAGQLRSQLGRDRAQAEVHDLGGVPEVEERVLRLAVEEDLVRLPRGRAEHPAEGVGLHQRAHDGLHERARRGEVRGPAVHDVGHDLATHHQAQTVVVESRDRAVGERLAVDDLLARVEREGSGQEHDRAQDHQHDARAGTEPVSGGAHASRRCRPHCIPSTGRDPPI